MRLMSLVTLDAVKAQLEISSTDVEDDTLLQTLVRNATQVVNEHTGRHFVPVRQTRSFDARWPVVDGRNLDLDADLLAVESITNGDGNAVGSSDYVLRPSNLYPKWRVRLKSGSSSVWWTYDDDYENAISVDGVWGYHDDYTNAWLDTNDEVENSGGMDASTQTLDVNDAGGVDERYQTRFAVGQTLRIDDEYLEVVAVDTDSDELTVLRGVLGTTAATHDVDTAIERWAVAPDIEQACISLTAWLYRTAQKPGERYTFLNTGTTVQINDAPVFIRQTLDAYRRPRQ